MKSLISVSLGVDPEPQCAGALCVAWVVFKPAANTSFMLYDVVK